MDKETNWQSWPAAEKKPGPDLPPLRVLLVDDEPLLINFLTEFLTGDRHTVVAAANGAEALAKFSEQTFDLVITDYAMPGLNGDVLARKLKERQSRVPVIMLTGFGTEKQAAGERPAGVDLLLGKPVTFHDLRQAILTVINK